MTQIQPMLPLLKWIPGITVQHNFIVTRIVHTIYGSITSLWTWLECKLLWGFGCILPFGATPHGPEAQCRAQSRCSAMLSMWKTGAWVNGMDPPQQKSSEKAAHSGCRDQGSLLREGGIKLSPREGQGLALVNAVQRMLRNERRDWQTWALVQRLESEKDGVTFVEDEFPDEGDHCGLVRLAPCFLGNVFPWFKWF